MERGVRSFSALLLKQLQGNLWEDERTTTRSSNSINSMFAVSHISHFSQFSKKLFMHPLPYENSNHSSRLRKASRYDSAVLLQLVTTPAHSPSLDEQCIYVACITPAGVCWLTGAEICACILDVYILVHQPIIGWYAPHPFFFLNWWLFLICKKQGLLVVLLAIIQPPRSHDDACMDCWCLLARSKQGQCILLSFCTTTRQDHTSHLLLLLWCCFLVLATLNGDAMHFLLFIVMEENRVAISHASHSLCVTIILYILA